MTERFVIASSLVGILSLGAAACHGAKTASVKSAGETKPADTKPAKTKPSEAKASKMIESDRFADEALSLASAGRMAEAEEALEKATAIYRDNHRAWYNLGQLRQHGKQYEAAAAAYTEAARVRNDDAMYHYKLGKTNWMANDVSSAQISLERAVLLNSRLYGAQYHLGQVYEAQGKPKQAAEAWSTAAALNPNFGLPFIDLGNLYLRWGKLAEALRVLDQGRLHVRDPEELGKIYFSLGMAHTKQANWDKSIEAHTNAMQTSSGNLQALFRRGMAYAKKGDKNSATKDLKSFVEQGGGGDAFHLQVANQRLFVLSAAP